MCFDRLGLLVTGSLVTLLSSFRERRSCKHALSALFDAFALYSSTPAFEVFVVLNSWSKHPGPCFFPGLFLFSRDVRPPSRLVYWHVYRLPPGARVSANSFLYSGSANACVVVFPRFGRMLVGEKISDFLYMCTLLVFVFSGARLAGAAGPSTSPCTPGDLLPGSQDSSVPMPSW